MVDKDQRLLCPDGRHRRDAARRDQRLAPARYVAHREDGLARQPAPVGRLGHDWVLDELDWVLDGPDCVVGESVCVLDPVFPLPDCAPVSPPGAPALVPASFRASSVAMIYPGEIGLVPWSAAVIFPLWYSNLSGS